jgi:tellurite resistance protein TerC
MPERWDPVKWAETLSLGRRAAASFLGADLTARASQPPAPPRAAIRHAGLWIALALAFGGVLWGWRGAEAARQYLAGYLIELGLSVDNVFVFILIFARFEVPPRHQARVLYWGVGTAVLLRVAFILAGVGAVRRCPWILYVFGAFLLYTGVRLLAAQGRKHALADPERNVVVRACRRFLPMTAKIDGPGFFTVENGRRLATPLLVVLLLIETADFLFALDSLPAVLAVTRSSLVAVSSNVFAVVGLRSLYLVLKGMIPRFRLLPPGLAVILVFVGAKMLAAPWVSISTAASLGVIGGILAVCLLAGRRTA